MSYPYRYETHLHTAEASACAIRSAEEQVRHYKALGYTGIIVTDHFFSGNTCIPKDLPWEERIDLFFIGYERAKAEGDRLGLSVFMGWEMKIRYAEFLVYNLDRNWLKANPDILNWTVEEHYNKVHEAGGFIVHAHPYRVRPYIKEIAVFPDYVDAVEVYNVGNRNDDFDRNALLFARKHNLPGTAGTDSHGIEDKHTGIAFSHKPESLNELINYIKTGDYELIKP